MREYYQIIGYMNNDKWNIKCGDAVYETYMIVRIDHIVLRSNELYNITAVREYIQEWPLNNIITKFGAVHSTYSKVSFNSGSRLFINKNQFNIKPMITEIK